jgi:hypothetical protein
MRLTFALARISGGMTLSGPKACFGSTKEVKIFAAFLHSPVHEEGCSLAGDAACDCGEANSERTGTLHTAQRRRQGVVDPKWHLDGRELYEGEGERSKDFGGVGSELEVRAG